MVKKDNLEDKIKANFSTKRNAIKTRLEELIDTTLEVRYREFLYPNSICTTDSEINRNEYTVYARQLSYDYGYTNSLMGSKELFESELKNIFEEFVYEYHKKGGFETELVEKPSLGIKFIFKHEDKTDTDDSNKEEKEDK